MTLAYPLHWPDGYPRTAPIRRRSGNFHVRPGDAMADLISEIHRNRDPSAGFVISTNLELRQDGLPRASGRNPEDPGVAIYFQREGRNVAIACDRYDAPWKNMRAIHLTLDAIRAIGRHGAAQAADRAFAGFVLLPPPKQWHEVLGVAKTATVDEITAAHRALAFKHHPDRGGSHERIAEINHARDTALEDRG